MGRKYFVWSFDDGLQQDKKIIEILRKYGMGATFHLNSALLGHEQMIGRIGNLGIHEYQLAAYQQKKFHLLPAVSHYRIPADEISQVYQGFEVASHTAHHVNCRKVSAQELKKEVQSDQKILSKLTGQKIRGFAYPFGAYQKNTPQLLQKWGIKYARTASLTHTFDFPSDPLKLPMTSWLCMKSARQKIQSFIDLQLEEKSDAFFLMFGHGYELDFQTPESNWQKFEAICEQLANQEIFCCSIRTALSMHQKEGVSEE